MIDKTKRDEWRRLAEAARDRRPITACAMEWPEALALLDEIERLESERDAAIARAEKSEAENEVNITREQLMGLAKVLARKRARAQTLAECNIYGLTGAERINMEVEYRLARDEATAAEQAYQKALKAYLKQ